MRVLALALGLAACTTWTYDSGAPDIPLVGNAPATTSLPRLNQNPASNLGIVSGAGGTVWATFQETVDDPKGSGAKVKAIRNVNLSGDGEELLTADRIDRYYYGFFIVNRPKDAMPPVTLLSIHTPGSMNDDQFTLPGGPAMMMVGGSDNLFLYWPQSSDTTQYAIYRRDKHDAPIRTFPVPDGTDPADPQATLELRFQFTGQALFIRDSAGHISWHSTNDAVALKLANPPVKDLDLGVRPQQWWVDEHDRNILTCGDDGLRQVPLDGSPDIVLDPDPCSPGAGFWFLSDQVIYGVGGEERKVSLIGKYGPTKVLDPGLRILGTIGDGRLFYSTDPPDRYQNGVGDGWLDGWRFMTRGGDISLSNDGKEVRWIDFAAQMSAIGDLYAAPIGGAPMPLARNVSEYAGMRDGRMLIEENHAEKSIDNRIVVLDVDKKHKHWVAQQASAFSCIDSMCTDLLVDVVSGATGYDIVRVAVPPAQ